MKEQAAGEWSNCSLLVPRRRCCCCCRRSCSRLSAPLSHPSSQRQESQHWTPSAAADEIGAAGVIAVPVKGESGATGCSLQRQQVHHHHAPSSHMIVKRQNKGNTSSFPSFSSIFPSTSFYCLLLLTLSLSLSLSHIRTSACNLFNCRISSASHLCERLEEADQFFFLAGNRDAD